MSKLAKAAGFLVCGVILTAVLMTQPLAQLAFSFLANVNYWISPAYVSPYTTAADLLNAAAPTGGGKLYRVVTSSPPGYQFWNGMTGNGDPENFLLIQGEGYWIVPAMNENPVLQTSHTPAAVPQGQLGLPDAPAAGIPLGGSIAPGMVTTHDYLVAVPWNTAMVDAEDLRVAFNDATVVTRFEDAPNQPPKYYFWTGSYGNDPGRSNFRLDVHQSYLIRASQTSGPVVLP